MLFTIGEAAAHIGITPSTLRYYDQEGLLPFVDRSKGGIRIFRASDLAWLRMINCLKTAGLSIKEIKTFVDLYIEGDSTLESRRDMFYARKEAVERQMETLQKTLDFIRYKCWYYDTAAAHGTMEVFREMDPGEIPAEIALLKKRAGVED